MSSQDVSSDLGKQLFRFLLTGGFNTLIGFSVILGLLAIGVSDLPANASGYAVGLIISFFINRNWTFGQSTGPHRRELVLFACAFAGAYSANLAIVVSGKAMGYDGQPVLHLAGVTVYTIVFFLLSKMMVYPAIDRTSTSQSSANRISLLWPEILLLTVLAGLLPILLSLRLTHDVSWQFWIARQLIHGVPLYEYIMEINPPLWFWMALPLEYFGIQWSIAGDRLYIVSIIIIAGWSAIVTGHLLFAKQARLRTIFMISCALLAIIAPIYDFGQREQITVLLALPYCALIFKRVNEERVSPLLMFLIAIGAAVGFALKHYFILVPISLELWYLLYHRQILKIIRVETVTLLLAAIAYVAAIVIFTPAFFTKVVPLVAASYHGYERPFVVQLLRNEVIIWLLAAVSYARMRKGIEQRDQRIADMLAISTIAFAACYFLQQKGWQYHAIPATVCATILMVHCLAIKQDVVRQITLHPAAFFAALLFLLTGIVRGPYNSEWADNMPNYLRDLRPGSSVMIVTADPRRVFPFVDDYKLVWPSRHFAHWMIAAIAHVENGKQQNAMTPELSAMARDIRIMLVEDLRCNPPEIIFSQIRNGSYSISPKRFRMTDFFRRDPLFRDYLAQNYRLKSTDRIFETYVRTTPLKTEGSNCYRITPRSV